jgi:hypothetical protein
MLDLLETAKHEAWQRVLESHQTLVETRTTAAADAHRDALVYWWSVCDLHHWEVMTRLAVFTGTASAAEASR